MSANSQALRFVLSLRMNSSFKTSRPGLFTLTVFLISSSVYLPRGAMGWSATGCHGNHAFSHSPYHF